MLTTPEDLERRRVDLEGSASLHALATRLAGHLQPLLAGPIALPRDKAQLSRDGGVCATDGARLTFDPASPAVHGCPRCGAAHRGQRHDRAWVWRYHLWLSERTIHLALLGALRRDARFQRRAGEWLAAYAELYPTLPNRDNVLGPTRLFFSTYLESIWLLQVCVAASLLEAGRAACAAEVRTRLEPVAGASADLIASFDEGRSNRQVWNSAALAAAGRWLGDGAMVRRAADRLRAELATAVRGDGLWFEGENYHFFALRGFQLAAEVLRTGPGGEDLYGEASTRSALERMYLAPLATVLPDLTVPARGDSPYGVSLRQPRFAELWEVGWARTGLSQLGSLLAALYDPAAPEGADEGMAEIAEHEQHRPGRRVRRDRLGWKALLWMPAAEPRASSAGWRPRSALLEESGVAVLRAGTDRYLSVECRGAGGGHAHPDALHLTLYWGAPVLADPGTGSYVQPSLHWYRSTLAHNAPGAAGVGQAAGEGWCAGFDERDGWAWCRGVVRGALGAGTTVTRTVLAGPAWVLDLVDVEAPADLTVDLPSHPLGEWEVEDPSPRQTQAGAHHVPGGAHGYGFLGGVRRFERPPQRLLQRGADGEIAWLMGPRPGELVLSATAPGPPDLAFADGAPARFLIRRAPGRGRWVQLFAPRAAGVVAVGEDRGAVVVRHADGGEERVMIDRGGVDITDRDARRVVFAARERPAPAPTARPAAAAPPPRIVSVPVLPRDPALDDWQRAIPEECQCVLGAEAYRRAEEPYGARGPFTARVGLAVVDATLYLGATVTKSDLHVRPADAADPLLDNEQPDIHSDGVQWYVGLDGWEGYLAVPEAVGGVRVRAVRGTHASAERVGGCWRRDDDGYVILLRLALGRRPRPGDEFPCNVVINEMYPERERRAGQLALSGGGGWVYLRGDREPVAAAAVAVVV